MLLADLPTLLLEAIERAQSHDQPRDAMCVLAKRIAATAGLSENADRRYTAHAITLAYDLYPHSQPLFFWADPRYAFCLFDDESSDLRHALTLHANDPAQFPASGITTPFLYVLHEIATDGMPPCAINIVTTAKALYPCPYRPDTPATDIFKSPPPTLSLLSDSEAYTFLHGPMAEQTPWEPDDITTQLAHTLPEHDPRLGHKQTTTAH